MSSTRAAVLREEIADLTAYLEGLPDDLRTSAAFDAYHARLRVLLRDLEGAELEERLDRLEAVVHRLQERVGRGRRRRPLVSRRAR